MISYRNFINMNPVAERDLRLDFFRGFALVTIFINHVPGTIFEHLTTRNFGFSDAAEAFVLMSGISAGLAYSSLLFRNFEDGVKAVYRRAFRLYLIHLLSTLIAVGVLLFGYFYLGTSELVQRVNLLSVFYEQENWLMGFLLLGHQIGYFNILPIYVVLLLMTPILVIIAKRSVTLMLVFSCSLWAAAGYFKFNIPNFPGSGHWFLDPFSWQLLFSIGLASGIMKKKRKSLAPFNALLFYTAIVYLIGALIVVQMSLWDHLNFSLLPSFIGGFDKSLLPLPRLIHILALFYVVSYVGLFDYVSRSKWAAPLVLMGKHSLAVFAWGSVIAIALQVLKEVMHLNVAQDAIILSSGLLIQWHAASYFERRKLILKADTQYGKGGSF